MSPRNTIYRVAASRDDLDHALAPTDGLLHDERLILRASSNAPTHDDVAAALAKVSSRSSAKRRVVVVAKSFLEAFSRDTFPPGSDDDDNNDDAAGFLVLVYPPDAKTQWKPNSESLKRDLSALTRHAFYSSFEAFELIEAHVDDLIEGSVPILARLATKLSPVSFETNPTTSSALISALREVRKWGGDSAFPLSSAVALGTLKEAEIARGTSKCSSSSVGRLVRCLKALLLPGKLPRKLIDTNAVLRRFIAAAPNSITLLLGTIGRCASISTRDVPLEIVCRVVSDSLVILPALEPTFPPSTLKTLTVPGSKSVSNRTLLLAALSRDVCEVTGLLHSDDTQVMMRALEELGARFAWSSDGNAVRVTGNKGVFRAPSKPLWMGNAGTATRFVISLLTLVTDPQCVTLVEGSSRMLERPQGPLVEALRANGCVLEYKGERGCLPLTVRGGGFPGGEMLLSGEISSQFVSSVLLAAPFARHPLVLTLAEAKPTSISYIEMTLATMTEFGVRVERLAVNKFRVPCGMGGYTAPAHYRVEADASSATYPLAVAAVTGSEARVLGVGSGSLQGDAGFCRLLERMGCQVSQDADSTTVVGPSRGQLCALPTVDMADLTDAFMTAVACAAVARGTTTITGIANQHVKECDRIKAMCTELEKIGVKCENLPDGIVVHGRPELVASSSSTCPEELPLLDTYDDHRIAMSLAVLASAVPSRFAIADKDCTDKTYPEFWDDFARQTGAGLNVRIGEFPLATPNPPHSFPPRTSVPHPTVVLVGMRGAGKTTLGKRAASHLGYSFHDADDLLLAHTGAASCAAIVEAKGWAGFRELEREMLVSFLDAHPSKCVLACGGGVVEHEGSRAILARHFPVIHVERDFADVRAYLDANANASAMATTTGEETPSKRIRTQDTSAEKKEPTGTNHRPAYGEPIETVYARRRPWYFACSDRHFLVPRNKTVYGTPEFSREWERAEAAFCRFLDSAVLGHPALPPLDESLPDLFLKVELGTDAEETRERVAVARMTGNGAPLAVVLRRVDQLHGPLVAALRCGVEGVVLADNEENSHVELGPPNHRSPLLALLSSEFSHVALLGISRCDPVRENYPTVRFARSSLERFYLFGYPIFSSPSPTFHNAVFAGFGASAAAGRHYELCSTLDAERVRGVIATSTFRGASVTIPHKTEMLGLCDYVSKDAAAVGAVNTLLRRADGSLAGENTDFLAIHNLVARALAASSSRPHDCNALLVVGAGGTARAACHAARKLGLQLAVYNRTHARAVELAESFGGIAVVGAADQLRALRLAAVVCTVPASAGWTAPEGVLRAGLVVMDAAYRPRRTALLQQAEAAGCVVIEGIAMLLEQAWEQARIWHAGSLLPDRRKSVELPEEAAVTRAVYAYYDESGIVRR